MSRFREEVKVIPAIAWVIAAVVYAGLVVALILTVPSNGGLGTGLGKAAFTIVIPAFPSILVLLIGYVNGDARRRGMRYVLWTLLAIFIPNAIGIILYFILRDPPLRGCPKCGAFAPGRFAFCPTCGSALARTCLTCRAAVEPGWSHCPSCGAGLRAA